MKNFAIPAFAVLAAAVCHLDCPAAVTEQPAVPVGNPDDQLRFFWGLDWRMYDSLPPAGFNMAIEHAHGTFYYDMEKGEGRQGPMPDYEKLAAKMKRDDFIWNVMLRPYSQRYMHRKYPRIGKDGKKFGCDFSSPGCMDELRKYVEYHADVAARIAAKTGCTVGMMPESEQRIFVKPSFAPHVAAAYKAATGLDVPDGVDGRAAPHWSKLKDFPADRVVDRDYPLLSFYRWFWKEGEGSAQYYRMALRIFREKLGYTPFSMYDPATREPPLWGTCGDVTHNNMWKTCLPSPLQHSYEISEQNAIAEGCPGQHVVSMVQGIMPSPAVAPTNDLPANVPEWRIKNPRAHQITPPPDMMLEQSWCVISRKIDGFGYHGWDALWVLGDDYGRGRDEYRFTNPESRKTIERFLRDVAVPLGPFLKAAPESPAEVAVLDCYSAAILSGVGWSDWERPARHCGYLADAANLAPVTLFEEAIANHGIPKTVKVILASGQDVMTKETAAALRAFQARGGKIVADKSFVPAIKADASFPSEDEVSAAVEAGGEAALVNVDDVASKEMSRAKDAGERDRKWRARAAALARICRAWAPVHVETDNGHIFLRTRTYGSADYVFAINDKRDFGDYVGPWRRVMEKGMPNEAVVTVRRKAGAVYDLVRHTAVPFTVKDGKTLIPVKYETSDGRLLMVVDRPLGALKFRAEPADGGARVGVISRDKDVMIPIKVESATGKPFYGVVQGGKWIRTIKGHSADSVKVTNLADGREFGWKGPAVAPFASGERVTFLGDSITHGGRYCANLQLFWDLRFPGSGTRLMNCGVSGETAAGGVARWEYDVLPQRADRVFVMFGMNDVGHGNYDPKVKVDEKVEARRKGSVDGYRKNMAKIADLAQSAGKKLALITPTPYDEYGNLYTAERRPGCNSQGLAEIASACRELAKERKAEVVEFYSPLTEFVRGQDKYMFCRPDRVHPTNEGHIIMTALFLEAMGVSPFVAQVDMRADGRVEKSAGAKVSQVEAAPRGLSFRYEPGTLPFPVTDEYRKADEFYPVTAKMNVELLKVSGLPEGEYDLLADGAVLGTISSRRFAEGVNLALLSTPAAKLALEAWGISRRLVAVQSRLRALVLTERKVNAKSTDDFEVVCAKMEKLVQDLKAKGVSTAGYYANNLETYRKDRQQIEQIRAEEDDIRRRLAEAAAKKASYVLTIRRR